MATIYTSYLLRASWKLLFFHDLVSVELVVKTLHVHQFTVCSRLNNLPTRDHSNAISFVNGGEAVERR